MVYICFNVLSQYNYTSLIVGKKNIVRNKVKRIILVTLIILKLHVLVY